MPKNKELTKRQQAMIRLYILSGESLGREELFRLAYDGSEADLSRLSTVPSIATRWWQSATVQNYYNEQKAVYADRAEKERLKIENEVAARFQQAGGHPAPRPGLIDYSSPDAARRKLNEIIATAPDNGEALDALKLLLQRQSELQPIVEDTPTHPAQRFYTPLQCHQCPLYQEAKNNI